MVIIYKKKQYSCHSELVIIILIRSKVMRHLSLDVTFLHHPAFFIGLKRPGTLPFRSYLNKKRHQKKPPK